jgi:ATP-dependent DNA helicase RecQ
MDVLKSPVLNPNHLLKQYFGYDEFRGLQHEIIDHISENKDCLILMPTGGGKSICYQIPALMREGITLVVSPLISLMKDQVDALKANGIGAAYLNSSLTYAQENEIATACFHGQIKLLYMSPEKIVGLMDGLLSKLPVSLIAIDEAHCVSQWGHDFRPEYKELFRLREKFATIPIMALTATADKITRSDILNLLGLREPKQFVASFDRPNISLTVKPGLNKKEKIKDIMAFINGRASECGIIYCTARNTTELVANELSQLGIKAKSYHAGMSNEDRSKVQEAFINDDVQVVCATIAFGMGIDKSNVRYVLHYNLPKSIESYYQEIGRGGRDGMPCDTVLYYTIGDLIMLQTFAKQSGQPEINVSKLKRIQEFAEAQHCRRRILLNYFGQNLIDNCGNCDVCNHPPVNTDSTVLALKALSALARIQQSGEDVGSHLLVDVLRGMRHSTIFERKLDKIKTYGAGADLSGRQWNFYMLQMIQLGVFEIAYDKGNVLRITSFGEEILKGQFKLFLNEPVEFVEQKPTGKTKRAAAEKAVLTKKSDGGSVSLFEQLRVLRKRIADEQSLPPYVVFHDSTLHDMVSKQPQNAHEMLLISGVSQSKMEKYGEHFLKVIKDSISSDDSLTVAMDDVISHENLLRYMQELNEKKLRFSTAVISKVLIGSIEDTYAVIGRQVSFYGIFPGMPYNELNRILKPFYDPYEKKAKEDKKKALLQKEAVELEIRVKAAAYFQSVKKDLLNEDEWLEVVNKIMAIPFHKTDEMLSDSVRELRKTYYRSHEPWSKEEETLLEHCVKHCNDLELIVKLFGRSENSILAMAAKWI